MGNRIHASCAVLFAIAVLTLPAVTTQAAEVEPPRILDVTPVFDFIVETIDVIRAIGFPSEAPADTPTIGGETEAAENESAGPEDESPGFGGQIEPVG